MIPFDWDVIVVGAGAAGLFAATRAAERGKRTLLIEKNRKAGVKILISGGTRCNVTHHTDAAGIRDAFGLQGRFLYSALALLDPAAVVRIIESEGVATKIESTGKIFPTSNRSVDVLRALLARMHRSGVELMLGETLGEILRLEGCEGFELRTSTRSLRARRIILTPGGKSYPGCGTRGDGYRWAAALGHTIITPRPALTPLTTNDPWVTSLTGITVPDAFVKIVEIDQALPASGDSTTAVNPGGPAVRPAPRHKKSGKRSEGVLEERRSSLLFTHFGFSGPAALDVSRAVSGHPAVSNLRMICDFLPSKSEQELDDLLRAASQSSGKKQIVGCLPPEIPQRLAEAILSRASIDPATRAAELSKAARLALIGAIKRLELKLSGTRGFEKAEVTAGGVSLDEVDSRTMQSKRIPGLYMAGEMLDLDGPIGGYNFQAAFSTGFLAGERVDD